ncbi:MAG: hypothetical protein HOO06_07545 [Bdellovibrionaceae bacterium]|jgi:hypothetical protein|nr:hypothetical protein [Pseudobdellovibrionaceae bacterium]
MNLIIGLCTLLLSFNTLAQEKIQKLDYQLNARGKQTATCISFFAAVRVVAEEKFPRLKTFSGGIGNDLPHSHRLYFSADNRKIQLKKVIPVEGRKQAMKIIDKKKSAFISELRKGFPKMTRTSVENWDTCADLNMQWIKVVPIEGFY